MPEHPTIAIPLDLPDVRVLRTDVTKERAVIIAVESTRFREAVCFDISRCCYALPTSLR